MLALSFTLASLILSALTDALPTNPHHQSRGIIEPTAAGIAYDAKPKALSDTFGFGLIGRDAESASTRAPNALDADEDDDAARAIGSVFESGVLSLPHNQIAPWEVVVEDPNGVLGVAWEVGLPWDFEGSMEKVKNAEGREEDPLEGVPLRSTREQKQWEALQAQV